MLVRHPLSRCRSWLLPGLHSLGINKSLLLPTLPASSALAAHLVCRFDTVSVEHGSSGCLVRGPSVCSSLNRPLFLEGPQFICWENKASIPWNVKGGRVRLPSPSQGRLQRHKGNMDAVQSFLSPSATALVGLLWYGDSWNLFHCKLKPFVPKN